MKRSVRKAFRFEMAHRLISSGGQFYSKSKCGSLHGHSVEVEVTLELKENAQLDDFGFVVDFGDFKPLKDWINLNLDHATIVSQNDSSLLAFLKEEGDRYYLVKGPAASSEVLCEEIYQQSVRLFENDRVRVTEVSLSETCTSRTTIRPL